jgi:phage shock protein C
MHRLTLSHDDKKLAGVCGGIAEYLGVDSTIVRLALVLVAVFTAVFPALLGYLAAWVIMPAPQRT